MLKGAKSKLSFIPRLQKEKALSKVSSFLASRKEVNFLLRNKGQALKLDANNIEHLKITAEIIKKGGIVAFPFNGIFGLFGDIDNIKAAEAIIEAKNRPKDKKLIAVNTPEKITSHASIKHIKSKRGDFIHFWKKLHALGLILPASTTAPYHLLVGDNGEKTILTIWTEYKPLRSMIKHFHSLGGRGLVGTSANKSGDATHFDPDEVYKEFSQNVAAVIFDSFDHLPEVRKKSTSVIDWTNGSPRLFREGNTTEREIRVALKEFGLPNLEIGRDVITVRARRSSA